MKEDLRLKWASYMYSDATPDAEAKPLTATEQAEFDRLMFDTYVDSQPKLVEEQPSTSVDNLELAKHILDNVVPTLDKRCQEWLKREDTETIARLLDDIDTVRDAYRRKHEAELSDTRVYHHYRMEYDQSSGDSQAGAYEALMLIDALMNGDIKNGRLPKAKASDFN